MSLILVDLAITSSSESNIKNDLIDNRDLVEVPLKRLLSEHSTYPILILEERRGVEQQRMSSGRESKSGGL